MYKAIKLKVNLYIIIGLISLVTTGVIFFRKGSAKTSGNSNLPDFVPPSEMDENVVHYLQNQTKKLARAFGTSKDSSWVNKWFNEDESVAMEIFKDTSEYIPSMRMLYEMHTDRNLSADIVEYMKNSQLSSLRLMGWID